MPDEHVRRILRRLLILRAPEAPWRMKLLQNHNHDMHQTWMGFNSLKVLMTVIVLLAHMDGLPWNEAGIAWEHRLAEREIGIQII